MGKSFGILIQITPLEENLNTEPLDIARSFISHTQKILNVISVVMENNAIFLATYSGTEQNNRFIFHIQTQCNEKKLQEFSKIPGLIFDFIERSIRFREAYITDKDKLTIERISRHNLNDNHLIKIERELNIITKKIVKSKETISVALFRIEGKDTANPKAKTPYFGSLFPTEEPKLPLMPPPPVGEQVETHQLKVSAKLSKKSEELLDLSIYISSQPIRVSSTPETLSKLARLMNSLLAQLELSAEINMAPDKNGYHKIISITDEREDTTDTADTEKS